MFKLKKITSTEERQQRAWVLNIFVAHFSVNSHSLTKCFRIYLFRENIVREFYIVFPHRIDIPEGERDVKHQNTGQITCYSENSIV